MIPTTETYAELQRAYEYFNRELFNSELPACLITLQRERRTLGYFSPKKFVHRQTAEVVDEIAMNPSYFSIRTITDTLSTLVHEMVHQHQQHFGKPGRRGYHNKEWAFHMERIGLIPSDTGEAGGKKTGESMDHYIAESGPFALACSRLMTDTFTLSWLDRFPPEKPKPHPPTGSSGKGYADDDDTETDGIENDYDELDDEIRAALAVVEPPPESPVNKSNRCKYTCPVCKTNLWGKPEVVAFCGGEHCNKSQFVANMD